MSKLFIRYTEVRNRNDAVSSADKTAALSVSGGLAVEESVHVGGRLHAETGIDCHGSSIGNVSLAQGPDDVVNRQYLEENVDNMSVEIDPATGKFRLAHAGLGPALTGASGDLLRLVLEDASLHIIGSGATSKLAVQRDLELNRLTLASTANAGQKWRLASGISSIVAATEQLDLLSPNGNTSLSIRGNDGTAVMYGKAKFVAGLSANGTLITDLATPVAATDAANKGYVDSIAQSLDIKDSVVAATVASGTLATSFVAGTVIDGITVQAGQRILIKDQTNAVENGIYIVSASGAPQRAVDFRVGLDVNGAYTFVEGGTIGKGNGYCVTSPGGADYVGANPLTFTQFSGAGMIIPGNALSKSGNRMDVVIDNISLEFAPTTTALRIKSGAISTGLSGGSGTAISVNANLPHVIGLGTVTSGVWNASTVAVPWGGTGASTLALDTFLLGAGTSPISPIADVTYARGTSTMRAVNTFASVSTTAPTHILSTTQGTNRGSLTLIVTAGTEFTNSLVNDVTLRSAGNLRIGIGAGAVASSLDILSDGSIIGVRADESSSMATGSVRFTGGMAVGKSVNIGIAMSVGLVANTAGVITGLSGALLDIRSSTFTNSVTAASGTSPDFSTFRIGQTTIAATATGVTTANASSLYIAGPPLPGTNTSILNPVAITVASGAVIINDTSSSISKTSGSLVAKGGLGVSGDFFLGGMAVIAGNSTLGGNLSVTGTSTFSGNMSIGTNPGTATTSGVTALSLTGNDTSFVQLSVTNTNVAGSQYNFGVGGSGNSGKSGQLFLYNTGAAAYVWQVAQTGSQTVNRIGTSGALPVAQFLTPSLAVAAGGTNRSELYLGAALTNYNTASIGFSYVAAGSTSNTLNLGFTGATSLVSINGSGAMSLGSAPVSIAKLAIAGTDSSLAGPHWAAYTSTDTTYPVFHQLNYTHNNIALNFDAFFDTQWRSSFAGSSAQIYKTGNALTIGYGVAAVNSVITWNTAMSVALTTGAITIPTAIGIAATANPVSSSGGTLNVVGDTVLGTTSRIFFPKGNIGPPTLTSRSIGTKLVIYPDVSASSADYAIGIEDSVMWYGVPSATSSAHKWYAGTTNIMTLIGTGSLSITNSFTQASAIYTDTTTAASTTKVTPWGYHAIAAPLLAASNTSVTTTTASTLYVAGPPVAGTNQTITTAYALHVASGAVFLAGNTTVAVTTQVASTVNPTSSTGGALNISGDVVLGATNPRIYFPSSGIGPPAFTNRSVGSKLVIFPGLSASSTDYALGIEGNTLWLSVPTTSGVFNFYGGTSSLGSLSSGGLVLNTLGTGPTVPLQMNNASLSTGSFTCLQLGVAAGNYQMARVYFNYVASGSIANSIGLGMWNAPQGLTVDGMGRTNLGSTTSGTIVPTSGQYFNVNPVTFTDSGTVASGTVSAFNANYMAQTTLSASNTGVTTTTASTLTIAGPPIASTNETITNAYSLRVASGNSFLGGKTYVSGVGTGGTVQIAPVTAAGEASISFYGTTTFAATSSGDQWTLGRNSWGQTGGAFALGCTPGYGLALSIAPSSGDMKILSVTDASILSGTAALQIAGGVSVGKWLTFNGGGSSALGSAASGGLSFEFGTAGGYRHWMRSRHDATGVTSGNAIDFYLNTATTAAGSSGVGTGNVLGMSVSATGVNVPTTLQVMGGTGVFRTASNISDYTIIGTNPTDGTANTRIVISGSTRASPSAGNIEYIATNTGQHVFTTQGTLVTFSITAAGTVNIPVATTLGGTVNPTGATGGALNIAGDVVLGATNPRIYFPINGVGPPSVATRSSGTKLVLYPSLGANSVDYALGIEANVLWYSVPDSTCSHKWYAGATTLMTLSGTGNLSVSGTGTIASNLTVGGYAMVGTTGGASSTVPNMIGFSGTFGESSTPASMHTALVERIYSGAEGSELLIFKGNDVTGASGPDVVRIAAAEFYFDALTVAGSYNYSTNTVPSVARKLSVTLTSASLTVPLTVTTGGGVVSSFVNSTSATSQTSITVQNTVNGTTGYFGLDGSGLQAFTQDALTLFVNNGKPIQLLTSANIQTNAPIIMTNNTLFGPPTFNTRSVGTKIVLWGGGVNSSSAEFALGIEASTLWSSVPETSSMFKWYGGTALVATLTGTGSLNLAGSEISLNSAENRVKLNSTGNAIWLCSVPGDAAGDFHLFDASGSGRILGWYRSTNVLALGAVNASTAVQVPGTLTIGGGAVITSPASGDGYNGNTLTLQSRAESSKYYLSFSGRVLSGGVVGWDITMANSAVTYSVMTFDRGNVTIPSALTVGGNMAMTGTAPSISGNGTTGPLSIDPNYTTNNYVRIFDRLSVAGTLDVTGDYINLGTANVPVGLVHEVGGNTPLLDMNVNYFPAAVGTVNTTYGGAMFRIDGRQGTTGTPIFQWATRASGSSSGITAASLDVAGNMTHYGNVAVGAGQNVGSLTLGNAGSTGGGVISSDPAHCLYYRYNYAGGINKMAMYSSGDIEFYNNGVIASQTLKMSIAASGLVSIAGPLTVSGTATLNGSVSIGNAPLSYAKLSLLGTHQSTNAGPHITAYTSADTTYPVSQVFNWSHDNVALLFDAYWNNSFISCHAGSSAQIYKIANFLKFNWGVASVGSVVPFNTALAINLANGAVAVSGPTLTVPTPVNPTDAATKAYVDGRAGTPTGSIVMYATSSAPTGWLLCDGAAVSRSTYSQLFAVVGTTYGGGDGSSTFNVPSFVNRFPVGAGSSYGNNSKGGTPDSTLVAHSHSYSGSTSYDTSPNHTHDMYLGRNFTETVSGSAGFGIGNFLPQSGRGNAEAYTSTNGSGSYGHSHSFSGATTQVGSSASGANLPPYIGIQFIIKT